MENRIYNIESIENGAEAAEGRDYGYDFGFLRLES